VDFTRYDITINGEQYYKQWKRRMMYLVVKKLIDDGVRPEEIADTVSWRKNNMFKEFDKELNEEQVIETLDGSQSNSKKPLHIRYFCKDEELFHIDNKTYLLSNQSLRGLVWVIFSLSG
jgi:hypothetical protein